MNNQHCTVLSTEDLEFPWALFVIGLILFATVVSFMTYHVVRYWQRRRAMPVDLPSGGDVDEVEILPERIDRVWQSGSV